ncbi:MAG: acyltransferase family protein [Desulfobacteraceae bacterium]
MLFDFLQNYEFDKLNVLHPDAVNYTIILFFSLSIFFYFKKSEKKGNDCFFSVSHTDHLRGFAIFFVVLGHLWVHVSQIRPQLVLSGDSVAVFLILSGFGLTITSKETKTGFKKFFSKRIKRVLVPYWFITVFILFFDFLFLHRLLSIKDIILTFLGINISEKLTHLDYARWYVTFILLWYFLFFIFGIKFKSKKTNFILFVMAFSLLPLNYYYFNFGWYQFFSFPFGCLLANYNERITAAYRRNKKLWIFSSVIFLIIFVIYKAGMSNEKINSIILESVPNIFIVFYSEFNSIIFAVGLLILSGVLMEKGYYSSFLLFIGKYSYEIFLIHGAVLIKYNPIITSGKMCFLPLEFLIYFILILLLSILAYRGYHLFYGNKNA